MLQGGLTATDNILGTIANSVAPLASYHLGQHAKATDGEGSAGHIVAHAILAGATAAANGGSGTDIAANAIVAGGAELAAPMIAKQLYGTSDSSQLTAEQKGTISGLVELTAAGAGAAVGNSGTAYSTNRAAQNAIDNNFLGAIDRSRSDAIKDRANNYIYGPERYFETDPNGAKELVEYDKKDARSDELHKKLHTGEILTPDEFSELKSYGIEAREQDWKKMAP